MKLPSFFLGFLLIATPALADETAVAPPPQIGIRVQLVEMHPGAAIAGGFLDASAIDAGDQHRGATRVEIVSPTASTDYRTVTDLVAEQGARIVAAKELLVAVGEQTTFSEHVDAPFPLFGEDQLEDDPFAELDFPGKLGFTVRVTPTLSTDGERITLKIESATRSAETWVSAGQTQSTQRRLRRGGQRYTLSVLPDTTIAISPAMSEEDRRDLAELGLADSVERPFFAQPQLGWTLYLLVTPFLIEDN